MGFFGKLFDQSSESICDRARGLLEREQFDKAFKLTQRQMSKTPDDRRVRDLHEQIRRKWIDSQLARADQLEQAGHLDGAADWLERALELVEDEARKDQLLTRLEAIDRQLQQPLPSPSQSQSATADHGPEQPSEDVDHYELLVGMLRDDIAQEYREMGEPFRDAVSAINAGDHAAAAGRLDTLLIETPDRAILRFERARCHLLAGENESAQAEFEAAWSDLGDQALDLAGNVSIPVLWGEACLKLKQPQRIVERLEQAAYRKDAGPHLASVYGQALLLAEDYDEAMTFLGAAARHYRSPVFPLLLAQPLEQKEQWKDAIACLEAATAASCGAGSCMAPPKHVPSLRYLAGLHVRFEHQPERVPELTTHIAQALRGQLARVDYLNLAAAYGMLGEQHRAEEALERANQISETTRADSAEPLPKISAGDQAIM